MDASSVYTLRFLRSSLYDSFERCFEEPCFLFGQEVREVLSYSPGINWPGVPERCNPLFGDHGMNNFVNFGILILLAIYK